MSYIEEAVTVVKESCERICNLINKISDDTSGSYDMSKAQMIYQLAAELQVKESTLRERTDVYEGSCHVNNVRATVEIGGFEVRGGIQFEIKKDNQWIKGHRYNSQYGQAFLCHDGSSIILSDEIIGRVVHPLQMDN